jgi:hypothetical protein
VDGAGNSAATWRAWTGRRADDIYLAERFSGEWMKASFHASGVWQIGFSRKAMEVMGVCPTKRLFARWHHHPEVAPGWTLAAQIAIGRSELRVGPGSDRGVVDVPMPLRHRDLIFELWIESPDARIVGFEEAAPVGILTLPGGGLVWVVSRAVALPWEVPSRFVTERKEAARQRDSEDLGSEARRIVVPGVDAKTGTILFVEVAVDPP